MVGHHVVTGSLGYFGLAPYLHFSGIFYFGIAEFTNIPLTFYDIFKYFPEYKTTFPAIYEGSRVIFALTFVALRLVVWPIVSYPFWVGSIELVQSGKAHSNTVVLTFLVANSFLTGLQFLWGSKIVSVLMSALSPSKSKKKA
jgi:hypothetical protein